MSSKATLNALLLAAWWTVSCDSPPQEAAVRPPEAVNEPPGFRPFNYQQWDRLKGNGWDYLRRTSSKDADVMADLAAPGLFGKVLRIVFTPDMRPSSEPGVNWIRLPRVKAVYVSWWIRLSSNWTAGPVGGGKMTFVSAAPDSQGRGVGQVYSNLAVPSPGPHHVNLNFEWPPYDQFWEPNVTTTPIRYGQWHHIEWYVKWESSPGAADGITRWWVNGELNGEHHDVRFPAGSDGFDQFEFAPTLGNPPPAVQYMYVDRTYVSFP